MVEVTRSVQYKSHEYNGVWTIGVQFHYMLVCFHIQKGEDRGEKVTVKLMRRKSCDAQGLGVLVRRKDCEVQRWGVPACTTSVENGGKRTRKGVRRGLLVLRYLMST